MQRGLVRVVCLRTDLCDPGMLGGRLFVENQNYVGSHALISYDNLLTAIDNEIPALIENTFFGILGDLDII